MRWRDLPRMALLAPRPERTASARTPTGVLPRGCTPPGRPELEETCEVPFAGKPRAVTVVGVPAGMPGWTNRLVAGRWPAPGAREALISEWTLYDWGVAEDTAAERMLGQRLRLSIRNDQNS